MRAVQLDLEYRGKPLVALVMETDAEIQHVAAARGQAHSHREGACPGRDSSDAWDMLKVFLRDRGVPYIKGFHEGKRR